MDFVIGKYYRDTFGRKLQYIGNNKNLYEFVLNNPNGSKRHIRVQSTDPTINQFVLIDDEDIQSDKEYPDEFDGGKVRRRKSRRRKSRRKKSRRKKSRRRR